MKPKTITIYKAYGQLDAQMIKIMLESAGIPAVISQESAGQTLGLTLGPLGEVDILVSEEHEMEARDIIDAYERGDLDLDNSPDTTFNEPGETPDQ